MKKIVCGLLFMVCLVIPVHARAYDLGVGIKQWSWNEGCCTETGTFDEISLAQNEGVLRYRVSVWHGYLMYNDPGYENYSRYLGYTASAGAVYQHILVIPEYMAWHKSIGDVSWKTLVVRTGLESPKVGRFVVAAGLVNPLWASARDTIVGRPDLGYDTCVTNHTRGRIGYFASIVRSFDNVDVRLEYEGRVYRQSDFHVIPATGGQWIIYHPSTRIDSTTIEIDFRF